MAELDPAYKPVFGVTQSNLDEGLRRFDALVATHGGYGAVNPNGNEKFKNAIKSVKRLENAGADAVLKGPNDITNAKRALDANFTTPAAAREVVDVTKLFTPKEKAVIDALEAHTAGDIGAAFAAVNASVEGGLKRRISAQNAKPNTNAVANPPIAFAGGVTVAEVGDARRLICELATPIAGGHAYNKATLNAGYEKLITGIGGNFNNLPDPIPANLQLALNAIKILQDGAGSVAGRGDDLTKAITLFEHNCGKDNLARKATAIVAAPDAIPAVAADPLVASTLVAAPVTMFTFKQQAVINALENHTPGNIGVAVAAVDKRISRVSAAGADGLENRNVAGNLALSSTDVIDLLSEKERAAITALRNIDIAKTLADNIKNLVTRSEGKRHASLSDFLNANGYVNKPTELEKNALSALAALSSDGRNPDEGVKILAKSASVLDTLDRAVVDIDNRKDVKSTNKELDAKRGKVRAKLEKSGINGSTALMGRQLTNAVEEEFVSDPTGITLRKELKDLERILEEKERALKIKNKIIDREAERNPNIMEINRTLSLEKKEFTRAAQEFDQEATVLVGKIDKSLGARNLDVVKESLQENRESVLRAKAILEERQEEKGVFEAIRVERVRYDATAIPAEKAAIAKKIEKINGDEGYGDDFSKVTIPNIAKSVASIFSDEVEGSIDRSSKKKKLSDVIALFEENPTLVNRGNRVFGEIEEGKMGRLEDFIHTAQKAFQENPATAKAPERLKDLLETGSKDSQAFYQTMFQEVVWKKMTDVEKANLATIYLNEKGKANSAVDLPNPDSLQGIFYAIAKIGGFLDSKLENVEDITDQIIREKQSKGKGAAKSDANSGDDLSTDEAHDVITKNFRGYLDRKKAGKLYDGKLSEQEGRIEQLESELKKKGHEVPDPIIASSSSNSGRLGSNDATSSSSRSSKEDLFKEFLEFLEWKGEEDKRDPSRRELQSKIREYEQDTRRPFFEDDSRPRRSYGGAPHRYESSYRDDYCDRPREDYRSYRDERPYRTDDRRFSRGYNDYRSSSYRDDNYDERPRPRYDDRHDERRHVGSRGYPEFEEFLEFKRKNTDQQASSNSGSRDNSARNTSSSSFSRDHSDSSSGRDTSSSATFSKRSAPEEREEDGKSESKALPRKVYDSNSVGGVDDIEGVKEYLSSSQAGKNAKGNILIPAICGDNATIQGESGGKPAKILDNGLVVIKYGDINKFRNHLREAEKESSGLSLTGKKCLTGSCPQSLISIVEIQEGNKEPSHVVVVSNSKGVRVHNITEEYYKEYILNAPKGFGKNKSENKDELMANYIPKIFDKGEERCALEGKKGEETKKQILKNYGNSLGLPGFPGGRKDRLKKALNDATFVISDRDEIVIERSKENHSRVVVSINGNVSKSSYISIGHDCFVKISSKGVIDEENIYKAKKGGGYTDIPVNDKSELKKAFASDGSDAGSSVRDILKAREDLDLVVYVHESTNDNKINTMIKGNVDHGYKLTAAMASLLIPLAPIALATPFLNLREINLAAKGFSDLNKAQSKAAKDGDIGGVVSAMGDAASERWKKAGKGEEVGYAELAANYTIGLPASVAVNVLAGVAAIPNTARHLAGAVLYKVASVTHVKTGKVVHNPSECIHAHGSDAKNKGVSY